jgi:beta-phosphoglucomutase
MHGDEDSLARRTLAAWAHRSHRAVIFDFNGTLSDDETILFEIFAEIFRERLGRSLTAEEYSGRLLGLSDREIITTIVEDAGQGDEAMVEALLRMRAERYRAKVAAASPIRADTVALVRRLADAEVPIGIVTGAQRSEVRFVLDRSPVGRHVAAVVTEEDVSVGKPDPEGFLLGARLLGRASEDILVFEDSVPGVVAARAGGMVCVAVAPGGGSRALADVAPARVSALGPGLLASLPGFSTT